MTTLIHPTAIVDSKAQIDSSVQIGPYAVIGPGVSIGAGTTIGPHTTIEGKTTLGANNQVFQFASIGAAPQDKKYNNEPTELIIGDSNTIREFVTLNRGTAQDKGATRIGSDNWIMAYVHVAHDCIVGDHCIFANSTNLAGHVEIGDWVILGGYTGIHQFCKVGPHAMSGVGSVVLHDIPPFVMVSGNTAQAHGINSEGLKRRGFAPDDIAQIRQAYKTLYKNGHTLAEAKLALAEQARSTGLPSVAMLASFLESVTRGIVR
jgi:UDP-N-acetylglucosamine acyltransferase